MHSHSLHEVRADAFNYVWDNSIAPVLEVESGAEVELHVRDAGDEQIGPDSGVDAVVALDFSHVNPVSGPVAVKGARPGDVLAHVLLHGARWLQILGNLRVHLVPRPADLTLEIAPERRQVFV